MSSRQKPILAAITVAVVAVVLFVALKPGDDSGDGSGADTATPAAATGQGTTGEGTAGGDQAAEPTRRQVPTVVFRNGEPVGGVLGVELNKGDTIRFRVKSDIADEVHVHGLDVSKEVPAGGTVSFSIPADITGIYEAEMENLGVQIVEIQIDP